MRSNAVVIVHIIFQNPAQMFLARDNDVVDALAPDRSDRPFGRSAKPFCQGEAGAISLSRIFNETIPRCGETCSSAMMGRTPARFTQADLNRAIQATKQVGAANHQSLGAEQASRSSSEPSAT
jgi:hypothetical protein